jgi:hypothetical protein
VVRELYSWGHKAFPDKKGEAFLFVDVDTLALKEQARHLYFFES